LSIIFLFFGEKIYGLGERDKRNYLCLGEGSKERRGERGRKGGGRREKGEGRREEGRREEGGGTEGGGRLLFVILLVLFKNDLDL